MPRRLAWAAWCLMAVGAALPARAQTAPDLVARTALRVCADPHNLPFSNEQGEGFENKIAELIGHELKLPVAYTWYPDSQGFVRNTLMKNRCDLVMGTVAGVEDMATTQSYYHTAYMMATRSADDIVTDRIGDRAIATKRFGLIAATPPTDLVVEHSLMDQAAIYQLMVDTRREQPAHTMLQDLASKKIDIGLLWGPIAGYYTKKEALPLRLVFLDPEDSKVRLDYHIAMGVRPSDVAFRRRLNEVIGKDQGQITDILKSFGIPLRDAPGGEAAKPGP